MQNKVMVIEENELQEFVQHLLNEMDLTDLPRMEWDPKAGLWKVQPDGEVLQTISFQPVRITNVWACWSETIGKPLCYDVGWEEARCDNPDHEPKKGMGIICMYDDFPAIIHCFGLTKQYLANAVMKRLRSGMSIMVQTGKREVKTQHGIFYQPYFAKRDEVENASE